MTDRFPWGRRLLYVPLRYMLIVPLLVALGVVLFYPLAFSFWVSLHHYVLTDLDNVVFVGTENYRVLQHDDSFINALRNTLIFVFGAVGLEFVFGFTLAQLLFQQRTLRNVYRSILLTPMFITPIAVGLIFRFLLNSQLGVIPYLLGKADMRIDFFGPKLALWSLVLIDVWQWTPFMLLLLLAGLESLPQEPFEAARIDGAGRFAIMYHLTLPLLRPVIMAAFIIRSLDAFKVFEYVWAITRGGPGEKTETILFHIYKEGFRFFRMGQAAAMGYVLVAVLVLLTFTVYWLLDRLPVRLALRRQRRIRRWMQE